MIVPSAASMAVAVLRARILRSCRPDSCVVSCKAAQRLLRLMEIEAKPLACSVLVVNRQWQDRTEAGLSPLDDPEAWSVGIGRKYVEPERYQGIGHLILIAPDRNLLIDPSLDQASRPLMPIEPLVIWLEPGQREILMAGGTLSWQNPSTGVCVVYTGHPDDRGYTRSPNWGNRDAALIARMVGDTVRAIRAAA